jgi:hypothetical protein
MALLLISIKKERKMKMSEYMYTNLSIFALINALAAAMMSRNMKRTSKYIDLSSERSLLLKPEFPLSSTTLSSWMT